MGTSTSRRVDSTPTCFIVSTARKAGGAYSVWAEEKIAKVSPLGRWQTPEECAAMAVFLASDHAKNITGQTINIDGGQVMHA